MTTLKYSLAILSVAGSMAAAACGGSSSISPTAPTGVGSTPVFGSTSTGATTSSGAVITGRVTGTSTSSAQLARSADGTSSFGGAQLASTAPGVITVRVVGTGTSTTVGPAGEFTLTGVPSGSVQLQFTGSSGSATVTISGVQSSDRIEISVALSGSTAKVESETRRQEDSNGVDVNGRVTAVGSGTLQVGTTLVTVPLTAVIRHGSQMLTLADIKVGDHVEVKGTKTATGVTATEIKVESGVDDDAPTIGNGKPGTGASKDDKDEPKGGSASSGKDDDKDDEDEAGSDELKGAVASLGAAACPNLSFVIKAVTVTTSAATKFDGISCGSIKVGTSLEVKGTRTGSTLAATKVEQD